MKKLKLVGIAMGMLFALSMMATTAALATVNLPDISITLRGTYPIHAVGKVGAETMFGTTGGVVLKGAGITLLLLTTELSALGTFNATFTTMLNSGNTSCSTAGNPAGTVTLLGEFHLVPTNLSPLNLGILFLLSQAEVVCVGNPATIVLQGSAVGGIKGLGEESTEISDFGVSLKGERSSQELSEYYNDGGTKVRASLRSEAGAGQLAASINIVEREIGLEVLGSQMLVITNR
jgi:hypothetical protein